jgi:hypothetical protein
VDGRRRARVADRPSRLRQARLLVDRARDQALLFLYRHAYASVLPSQYEGYGLPVVEALSQGCVTVASDAGSLPEVVAGHAVFFRRGDGEALHAILDRLYGDRDYCARLKRQPGASARHPGARQVGPSRRRSPTSPSFDRGMRNAWKLLAEAAYRPLAYASHMPQIVNKSLANEIFDRFVISPDGPAYDEWSLYFNVAQQLYPRHFATKPHGALGWPMRPGDWLPEIKLVEPAFENYYPQNYQTAERGMFVGLDPLGDLEANASRSREALADASRAEIKGGGAHSPGLLALIVTLEALKFVGSGTILAGMRNARVFSSSTAPPMSLL